MLRLILELTRVIRIERKGVIEEGEGGEELD